MRSLVPLSFYGTMSSMMINYPHELPHQGFISLNKTGRQFVRYSLLMSFDAQPQW